MIERIDQLQFPRAVPMFDLLFGGDGILDPVKPLKPDQFPDLIPSREPFVYHPFMLLHPTPQGVGDTDVKRAIAIAGKDVDVVGAHVAIHRGKGDGVNAFLKRLDSRSTTPPANKLSAGDPGRRE